MSGSDDIRAVLGDMDAGRVCYDEPMSLHTSLRVGGKTDALIFIHHEAQLIRVVKTLREEKIKFFTAGNLTNVIVRDGGYRGAIVVMTGMNLVTCEPAAGGERYLSAQAGVSLAALVGRSASESLTGLEFCSGIPGSVGGAVWMNAGAYGREIKDAIESVTILDTEGAVRTMKREEISFAYRKTSFPDGAIITGARFTLQEGDPGDIKMRINDMMRWRREKHPLEYPSAGSVFKNPAGLPAGRLIEELGLKGMVSGDAQISSKHANFIVNTGRAKASDIIRLIETVQAKAEKERQVALETEVVIIGED